MRRLPWFEDFNDHTAHPASAAENPSPPPDGPPDPRIEAWTEGFLAGCRATHANAAGQNQDVAAEMARRVAGIEQSLSAMADQSAVTVGGLLIDILTASLPAGWPDSAAERLEPIVDAIRPIFELEPRLHIRSSQPGEVSFHDLPDLYKALEAGDWELAVRWHQAAAEIDPPRLAAAIRHAISPGPGEALPIPPSSVEP
jgi:hypothetical protein